MDRPDRQPRHTDLAADMETTFDGAYVEAIARRVAELIHTDDRADISGRLVDAATLADELGVERSWVYDHAHELHSIRLGNGPRARLRFNPEAVHAALDRKPLGSPQTAASGRQPTGAIRARRPRPKSQAGRVLAVRPRGAS